MGNVKIPYYVVVKGRGYWRPHPRMRLHGYSIVRCGPDGATAWTIAEGWNARWQAFRRGEEPAPNATSVDRYQAESMRRYPVGSVGSAFQAYLRTEEWKKKAHGTRMKIWWPAWFRIRDMWGDVRPDTITFQEMSAWRSAMESHRGNHVAHDTIKVWRALWNVMTGMKIATGADPSTGVRNSAPQPRYKRWEEGEAVRLVKGAWRMGYRGLSCIIAIAWDSQFSPIDVRTLCERHHASAVDGLYFDRSAEGRAKTGRAAFGTLSRRTERLVAHYLAVTFGEAERLPDAVLFRNRSGGAYREKSLADDFADVRAIVFPGDSRWLADMRRSGTVEAVAGQVDALGLSAKLANSIARSNFLHKTYAPTDIESVRDVDVARRKGRRKLRAASQKRG